MTLSPLASDLASHDLLSLRLSSECCFALSLSLSSLFLRILCESKAWVSIEGLRSTATLAMQPGLEILDGESLGKPRETPRAGHGGASDVIWAIEIDDGTTEKWQHRGGQSELGLNLLSNDVIGYGSGACLNWDGCGFV